MANFKLVILLILPLFVSPKTVKIGIISDRTNPRQNSNRFWSFTQNGSSLTLEPVDRTASSWGTIDVLRAVCELAKENCSALVVLGTSRLNSILATYSDQLALPLITAMDTRRTLGKYQINILPDTSQAAADLLTHYNWDSFVFLYDTDNGADQLQRIFRHMDMVPNVEAFWRISDAHQASQYVELLPSSSNKILLAVSEKTADELVDYLSAKRKMFHFILLKPVGVVQRIRTSGAYQFTKLSVVDPMEPLLKALEHRWKTLDLYPSLRTREKELPDSVLLSHDASSILYSMFSQMLREGKRIPVPTKGQDCFGIKTEVEEFNDFVKKVTVERSVTGRISFNKEGQRKDYKIYIFETTPTAVKKFATWTENERLQIIPEFAKMAAPTFAPFTTRPPIRVTSVQVWPFLRKNPDNTYTGYVPDLLDELQYVMDMSFDLRLVKDGGYGNNRTGVWNGMIGELIRGEADAAISSLTKTHEREVVVDFSRIFMTIGLNILMKKQEQDDDAHDNQFGPFSFLSVWSEQVWLIVLLAAGVFSALCYATSRFIGSPDRVRALETKGTDNLSPCGSVWFTFGSLLFRGTGIYPRTVSHRLWALLWWTFCLFLLMMYISSLTSDLIRTRARITTIQSRKSSQQILKEVLETGYPAIGTVKSGSTANFFLKSEIGLYRDIGNYFSDNPSLLTNTYHEGVDRVRSSGGAYAYIMESASSELWAESEPCDLLISSGFLTTRPYAVALPKNSPLREPLDDAIIKLMESGILRKLYEKWWHNTSSCEDPNLDLLPRIYNTSMTLHEVSGLFYLLILFALLSLATAAVEHYVRGRRMTIE